MSQIIELNNRQAVFTKLISSSSLIGKWEPLPMPLAWPLRSTPSPMVLSSSDNGPESVDICHSETRAEEEQKGSRRRDVGLGRAWCQVKFDLSIFMISDSLKSCDILACSFSFPLDGQCVQFAIYHQ